MQVFVRFRLPGDRLIEAPPGSLIGRLPSAALYINDPRISEAHALVSLRGRNLRLLALRGRFAVGGEVTSDAALTPGMVIQLAPGLELVVVAVMLSTVVAGLEGPDIPRQVLPPVASLYESGELVSGFSPDAHALLWTAGPSLFLRTGSGPDRELALGTRFEVGEREYTVVPIALDDTPPTERDADEPLTIILRYDTVHVHRGSDVIAIDGMPARLLSELGVMGVPVEWRTLAAQLWPEDLDESALRSRFDRVMTRLRSRLRETGLRADLARTDGAGRVELMLGPRDRVRDET